jgi:hypothetical protein
MQGASASTSSDVFRVREMIVHEIESSLDNPEVRVTLGPLFSHAGALAGYLRRMQTMVDEVRADPSAVIDPVRVDRFETLVRLLQVRIAARL